MTSEPQQATLNLIDLQETAFSDLYTKKIEPILQAREGERVDAVKTFFRRAIAGSIVSVALCGLVYVIVHDVEFAGYAIAIGGALTAWYAYAPVQAVANATKFQSLKTIAEAIACSYTVGGFAPDGIEFFTHLSLLPGCDRSNYQDRFAGQHHGCDFAFYDGHLERKVRTNKSTSWQTVFRGQLICIEFPKKFLGTTIVRRDAGMFNFLQRWTTTLQRVGLGDSRLERAFEAYSNDQVEARYLIHPVFMERLLDLETRFRGEKLRCAFHEGRLLIAIEGGDKFELGSMFSTLLDVKRVRNVINDLAEIMKVIEAVLTAERGALPE
ncbi:MAG: DUF3137 domain-containing protein [Micropepsaceae bacterium]